MFGSGRIKACLCLRSRPTTLCCPQFFSSSFLRLVRTECFKTLCTFSIERPRRPQAPPSWDLDAVLRHLTSSAFEPLESVSLRTLTKKTLLLVSLATAKRVSEIQALSKTVAAIGNDLVVSFQPHFIAKTEHVDAPVPRSFVFSRCGSSQGTWRKAPSYVPCGLSTSTCGERVLLLLEPLLCLCLLGPPLVRSQRMRFRIF